jgi:hypothetical protein
MKAVEAAILDGHIFKRCLVSFTCYAHDRHEMKIEVTASNKFKELYCELYPVPNQVDFATMLIELRQLGCLF